MMVIARTPRDDDIFSAPSLVGANINGEIDTGLDRGCIGRDPNYIC